MWRQRVPIPILVGMALVLGTVAAHAEKRAALVIGNSAYQHTRALPNPKNDAAAIAKLLKDMGFEVTPRIDLDYREMREAIRAFGRTARTADIALVYFAGHGLELGGENYLVPTDATLAQDVDLDYEVLTLSSVLNTLGSGRRLTLVILDSCRNNPLGDKMAVRSGAARSVTRGLGRPEPKGNVLVAYSAKHGTLALDGEGTHSPYAEALLKHMATADLDVRQMFGRVRDHVLDATRQRPDPQEPHIYGSLGGETLTLPVDTRIAKKEAALPPSPQSTLPQLPEQMQALEVAMRSRSVAALEVVARRYPGTVVADMARAEAEALIKQQTLGVVTPPPKPSGPPAPVQSTAGVFLPQRAAGPLTVAEERTLKFGDTFKECDTCGEMVVVPAGRFTMGSPANEPERYPDETQVSVTIAKPFAVGKYEVTFAEWD
ncbi:MAG: caspase family protein, partial [Hyphomicrobiaceae bacterium]